MLISAFLWKTRKTKLHVTLFFTYSKVTEADWPDFVFSVPVAIVNI